MAIIKSLSKCHLIKFFIFCLVSLIYGVAATVPWAALPVTAVKTISCEHQSIQELIKTSPVILKALGAKIFADSTQSEKLNSALPDGSGSINMSFNTKTRENASISSSTLNIKRTSAVKMTSYIITLAPETLYKGASILKVASSSLASHHHTLSLPTLSDSSKEYFEYEGQLNATLEPLECFDRDVLNLLPTQLIAFGKLDNYQTDLLRVNINGLHQWSPQFESHIWRYLGWDDWSDFATCSVTCGKGVQQRFRRCLFDSGSESNPDKNSQSQQQRNFYSSIVNSNNNNENFNKKNNNFDDDNTFYPSSPYTSSLPSHQQFKMKWQKSNNFNHSKLFSRIQSSETKNAHSGNSTKILKKRRKKKKSKGGLSTLSCEGYNIEQRNCNMFECRDDISDLLKFHKRTSGMNENTSSLTTDSPAASFSSNSIGIGSSGEVTATVTESTNAIVKTIGSIAATSSSSAPGFSFFSSFGSTGVTQPYLTTTTTSGSVHLHEWKNPTNFTLMTTLRAKNKTQSTIFSIRNSTHNLYLEQSFDGLKLFQERDDVTEMLPIKLDLYDNRWHQISISVYNGDFITVYIDCVWTNSFVVSKGLYTLPQNADVEVGRTNDCDLQQLLLMPGNHEKLQCSALRTSINEVKRYIIDTFIDEDSK